MPDAGEPIQTRAKFSPDAVHLLRTTQQVQYQLSQMADQKASILLGITFVIFTIALGQAHGGRPSAPILVLGGAAFVAAFLTVMAVLPSVKTPPRIGPDSNLLFFSNYTQMSEPEFIGAMLDKATDPQVIFEAFLRDIYQNGCVLAKKKYRLLGYAYRVLLVGMVCSLATFAAPYALMAAKALQF